MAQQSMCDIIPHGMEVSPTRPWNGRASTKCLAFQLNKSGIRTGSLRTKLSVARKRNFQSRDKGAETVSKVQNPKNFKAETRRKGLRVLRLPTETTKPSPARTAGGAPRPALKCGYTGNGHVGRFARRCESVDMPRFEFVGGGPGASFLEGGRGWGGGGGGGGGGVCVFFFFVGRGGGGERFVGGEGGFFWGEGR